MKVYIEKIAARMNHILERIPIILQGLFQDGIIFTTEDKIKYLNGQGIPSKQ